MPGVRAETVKAAKEVDLLTYLQSREPGELKRSAPGEYRTRSHGSLVISNGRWYWNREGFGGRSALDYLIKVRGMGFVDAVNAVSGGSSVPLPVAREPAKEVLNEPKRLMLPEPVRFPSHVLSYLQGRGIASDVIRRCFEDGSIYEGRFNGEVVCAFVGKDVGGEARFACMRGVNSGLKRDFSGSDKRFGFCLDALDRDCRSVVVFESPIDTLSHLCLFPELDTHRLSLGGTAPLALTAFLERNPQIENVALCLDADYAGRKGSERIRALLGENYPAIHATITPPPFGKDYNNALQHERQIEKQSRQHADREVGFSI
jgi:hypothetical protein